MIGFPYIYKAGVELEGGWDKTIPNHLFNQRQHDGSVHFDRRPRNFIGELAIGPYGSWDEMKSDLILGWPDHVNQSCGLHVHVSTQSVAEYSYLMERRQHDLILKGIRTWGKQAKLPASHEFWTRVAGHNEFCRPNYMPDDQVPYHNKGPNRYAAVNYCHGYHGTVEIRVLPAFASYVTGTEAIYAVLRILNRILRLPEARRPKALIETKLTSDDFTLPSPVETHRVLRIGA